MRRTIKGGEVLLWLLCAAAIIASLTSLTLALVYSSEHGFLYVPFASWFVFGLGVLMLALAGIACYFWRRLGVASRELIDLKREPLDDGLPVIWGHKHLDQAEFLVILQSLFRRPPDIQYVRVRPLPGGHGGGATLLAELQRQGDASPLPRTFVVKLGDRREMVDEHDKYHTYVLGHLGRAARFFRQAAWGDYAGIAYEFVGLDPDDEIRNFYQFYQGYAALEVAALVGEVYSCLERTWYRNGRQDQADLYAEYDLLHRKEKPIIEHVGEIVDEADPYRTNFTLVEERLRPNLKPGFCPDLDFPWYDPVAFLRTWPRRNLAAPIHRSIVHGDLHAQNILVDIGRDGRKQVWFIDFSHSGNGRSLARSREAVREGIPIDPDRGHTLRDFCRLEADVKFILTRLQDEADVRLAVAFEKELLNCGLALHETPAAHPPLADALDERFQKAWQVIREIRSRAAAYLARPDDLRPYYLGLLNATLPILYYHPAQFENEVSEQQQKRYALIAAGMLCSQL